MPYKLILQRHFLELHTMDAGVSGTEQRSCCEDEVVPHLLDEVRVTPKNNLKNTTKILGYAVSDRS